MKMHFHNPLLKVSVSYIEEIEDVDATWWNLSQETFVFLINWHNNSSLTGTHEENSWFMLSKLCEDTQ